MHRPVAAILVVLAAAASAGIHAGLVPEHLGEMPQLGVSFAFAVLALLAIGAAVTIRAQAFLPASLAALLFAGLILAYVASRTTGLPALEPEPERVDAIGVVTVGVQAVGAVGALWLTRTAGRQRSPTPSGPLPHRSASLVLAGLVAISSALIALGAGGGEGHDEIGHGAMHGHEPMHPEAGPTGATSID